MLLRVVSNSFTSAPAAKALSPAPFTTNARTSAVIEACSTASRSACHMDRLNALRTSGRFSVMVAMGALMSSRIASGITTTLLGQQARAHNFAAGPLAGLHQMEEILNESIEQGWLLDIDGVAALPHH